MPHRNAPLSPEGRRRLIERIERGQHLAHVAAGAGISRQCLSTWYRRWLQFGEDGLHDRSSRPQRSPRRTPVAVEDRVEKLRRDKKLGPVQIAGVLGEEGVNLAASTVHRILQRRGISRLRDIDPSGEDLRTPPVRYEHPHPGSLVHVDVKKFGRIPDGGGWRIHGRGSAAANATRATKRGRPRQAAYTYLHSAVDDHSRLAYTEALPDETAATAAAFWHRAVAFYAHHGITTIERCMTDNALAYRSIAFGAALLTSATTHKRTRAYRPQTNGKVERYQQTLAREWGYATDYLSETERATALPAFLHRYNYHRPHTALGGKPPISRCPAVNNVSGHDILGFGEGGEGSGDFRNGKTKVGAISP